ncbi:BTAD domain-containing putative transcriptional regulator [Solwaraspora sp. WMMD406]|uniref:AfsR/SARP family transcriptional regulator n=1 Tax=Solwaraspora sp. WMMD406 TaxID=3016095 RepID=UPI002415D185|nr:BTAD domain-containing putative transcriptional regulator [Solwaraspora sp. WMMD406]MDG4763416.1 BTAD domain-containing putative transcriptional regulator [Solwaraspora sp. WMMD406]
MNFKVLGNLEVWASARRLPALPPRQERFLARLLLSPNTLVSIGALTEALWDGEPPASAERQVQNTASQLRQAWLGAGVAAAKEVLRTARAGYSLDVDLDQIDLYLFRDMVAQASALAEASDLQTAVARLRQALGLWRAPAFAGIDSRVIQGNALLINEERPAAWEHCMRLELQAGLHGRVVTELAALVAEFPFREQLTGLFMAALYRTGRQTDALHAYQKVRTLLNDELGIDPGPELQELHRRILQNDPALLGPAAYETVAAVPPPVLSAAMPPVPRQIPPPDGSFTGRHDALTLLEQHCGQAQVLVVAGAAGMGKTSLVARWAHQAQERFPDGHIFLDLRGHSTDASRSPGGVLAHILESLNLPPQKIPATLERRIALYRSAIADKKALIVLDNAGTIDQVLPAVPPGGGSQLVVTSRNNMAALHTHLAVKGLALEGLSREESRSVLLGATEPASAAAVRALERLLDLCGGMPLALRILAARLVAETSLTVEGLAADLSRGGASLDGFAIDGDARSVRSVLANAYATLSADDARLFRLLAVHPGRRMRPELVAALAALPLSVVQRSLDNMIALHLVTETGNRYLTMHDLVRSFAAECLEARAGDDRPDQAVDRLLGWYLSVAAMANGTLRPDRDAFADSTARVETFIEPFAEDVDAISFLEEESENLAPITTVAVRHDIDRAVELIYHLHSYFVRSGFSTADVDAWMRCGADAHRIDRPLVRAHLYHALGGALAVTHDLDAAAGHLRLATEFYEREGHPGGAAGSLLGLGFVYETQGRYRDALTEYERALQLAQAAQNTTLVVHSLNNSADALVALDDIDAGLERLKTGRELAGQGGLRHHEAAILSSIGALFVRKRAYAEALEYLHEGLALMRRSGFRTAEADTLVRIGHAVLGSGNRTDAVAWFRQAQKVYRQNNDATGEADMARLIGDLADSPQTA